MKKDNKHRIVDHNNRNFFLWYAVLFTVMYIFLSNVELVEHLNNLKLRWRLNVRHTQNVLKIFCIIDFEDKDCFSYFIILLFSYRILGWDG